MSPAAEFCRRLESPHELGGCPCVECFAAVRPGGD